MFFYVINHFAPSGSARYLTASTLFAAALAVAARQVSSVLVVDGSEQPNRDLRTQLNALGVHYHHAGRTLTFAEGYNLGLSLSDQPWTILSASDVYPSQALFDVLSSLCRSNPGQDIGCIIPQMNNVDLDLQSDRRGKLRKPIDLPLMTLNLNAFPTGYLRSIGGVPEEFSGTYNDVILSLRMFKDKRRIVLAPVSCLHYGSLTLKSGASKVSFSKDMARFAANYPDIYLEGSVFSLDFGKFTRSWRLKLLAALVKLLPPVMRQRAAMHAMRLGLRPFA
ncbi:MAG: glycosyltransferase family 2 protein [Novosphingobium sp.]